MTSHSSRVALQAAFTRLTALVEPEGYEATRWTRELRAIQQVLSDDDLSDAEAIDDVRLRYRELYHGGRNFSDFFLWREDEMERRLANDELNAAKQAVEDLLGVAW